MEIFYPFGNYLPLTLLEIYRIHKNVWRVTPIRKQIALKQKSLRVVEYNQQINLVLIVCNDAQVKHILAIITKLDKAWPLCDKLKS